MDLLAETIVLSCPECCIEVVKPRLEEQGLSLSELTRLECESVPELIFFLIILETDATYMTSKQ